MVRVAGCGWTGAAFGWIMGDRGDALSTTVARRRVPFVEAKQVLWLIGLTAMCFKRAENMVMVHRGGQTGFKISRVSIGRGLPQMIRDVVLRGERGDSGSIHGC